MPLRVRIVVLCVTLALSLSAYAGSTSFDATYLLAGIGLTGLAAAARQVWNRDREREKWEYRVDGALWGPEDANGKRNVEVGSVALIARTSSDLEELRREVVDLTKETKRAVDAALFAASLIEKETLTDRRRRDE